MARVIQVTSDRDYIYIENMPYDLESNESLKIEFGARWDSDEAYWYVDACDHSVDAIVAFLELHFPLCDIEHE
jgi:hypothetical protein